jgi:hypothetical protein
MEMERNLMDAMLVARNVFLNPRLLPGGGAVDMAISVALRAKSMTISGVDRLVYVCRRWRRWCWWRRRRRLSTMTQLLKMREDGGCGVAELCHRVGRSCGPCLLW